MDAEPVATPIIWTLQLVVELDRAHDAGVTVATPVLLDARVTFAVPPPVRVRVTSRETAGVVETWVVLNERDACDEDPEPPPHDEISPIPTINAEVRMNVFMMVSPVVLNDYDIKLR